MKTSVITGVLPGKQAGLSPGLSGGETQAPVVPVRGLCCYLVGLGTEDNIPSDLYYAALDGDFNADGDSCWGEQEDGTDLLPEVWVGRAPADGCGEVGNFVRKTLDYQNAAGDWLRNVYMVGEWLWDNNGDHEFGIDFLTDVQNSSTADGYDTKGFSESSFYQVAVLDDKFMSGPNCPGQLSPCWSQADILAVLNGGNHIINHLGHSYTDYNMRLYCNDLPGGLTNTLPFFDYSQGCYPAAFDNRTDSSYGYAVLEQDSFVEYLLLGDHGAFAAVMLAAFISTHDTYLHSWGSILVQDVILPLCRKPLDPKRHIFWLRLSIFGVAVFIFCFSLLFRQSEYILLFFAITGAIYAGGSGAVIIGGLYWKRGTTPAAWTSMLTGSIVSVLGILLQQVTAHSSLFHALSLANGELHRLTGQGAFPVEAMETLGSINGQVYWFIAIAASLALYALVSLLGPRRDFDMDRLLHRGKYRIEGEYEEVSPAPAGKLRFLGVDREFTRGDKVIYLVTYAWIFAWFAVFVAGTVAELFTDIPDETWMGFWYVFILLNVGASVIVTVWFTLGGVLDLKYMFRRLGTMTRDHTDDGRVR